MLRFGLPATMRRDVARLAKDADVIAAHYEARLLAGFSAEESVRFFGKPVALPKPVLALLEPWPTETAEQRFLARFDALLSQAEPLPQR